MPFLKGRHPTNVNNTLNCTLCNLVFDPKSVEQGAEQTLERYSRWALQNRYAEKLIPQDAVIAAYDGISKDETKDTPLSITQKVGRNLGANLMLLGTVWRYLDREGSPAGATRPASVAFDMYLLDVESGTLLWSANFDETQRSLSENILDASVFFKRGAKWLSASELADYGVREIVKKLPI
jgi:hypothetical protein